MNYFGHAVVSLRIAQHAAASAFDHAGTAGHVLGAMLPDFASMCGARLDHAGDPQVAAGVEFHHRTDAVFHHLPPVLALMRELEERLRGAGASRGPTRAVSHLGVELLLDGVLVADAAARRLYVEALELPAEHLRWREPEHPARFAALHARLRHYGVPDDLTSASSVTERLLRVISRRPLLAPRGGDAAIIGSVIAGYQPRVTVAAETILRGVLASLHHGGGASAPAS
jgi:hypothetical protein